MIYQQVTLVFLENKDGNIRKKGDIIMVEPFLYTINRELEDPAYCEPAPVEFKNPNHVLTLVPVTSRILTLDRDFYSKEEIKADKMILKAARENTMKSQIRKNTDNDFISIRSNKTEIPCVAAFMLQNREKLFKALNIEIDDYYVVFITPDEILFAEKAKYKPTQIRKVTANIRNKLNSLCQDNTPILATEVFEYDKEQSKYVEI